MPIADLENFQKIKNGDASHFEQLFRHYYPQLCFYAEQLIHNKEEAEEIVQELFLQLWSKRKKLEIKISVNAYLYKATYLNSMAWLRKQKVRQQFVKQQSKEEHHVSERGAEQNEINEIINETLLAMPVKVREVFKMSRFEGLKYREISEKLSISVKTVEANMGKALKIFRVTLRDYVRMWIL